MKNNKKTYNIKIKDFVNYGLVLALLVYGVVLLSMGGLRPSMAQLFAQIGYSIILAVSLNLVVGFLGELSLGHAGFMCVGAYVGGLFAVVLKQNMPQMKLPVLIVSMLVGGLVAAVFGFVLTAVSFLLLAIKREPPTEILILA